MIFVIMFFLQNFDQYFSIVDNIDIIIFYENPKYHL